jgi:hypothetical protein
MERTIDRINQLSAERGRLYLQATNGHRGDPDVLARVHALDAELKRLWDIRRQEKAVQRDVIDRLVDRAYAQTYGRGYEDAVSPPKVAETADQAA